MRWHLYQSCRLFSSVQLYIRVLTTKPLLEAWLPLVGMNRQTDVRHWKGRKKCINPTEDQNKGFRGLEWEWQTIFENWNSHSTSWSSHLLLILGLVCYTWLTSQPVELWSLPSLRLHLAAPRSCDILHSTFLTVPVLFCTFYCVHVLYSHTLINFHLIRLEAFEKWKLCNKFKPFKAALPYAPGQ